MKAIGRRCAVNLDSIESVSTAERTRFGRITGLLPPSITLKLAKKSIQGYSAEAGHDLSYRLV